MKKDITENDFKRALNRTDAPKPDSRAAWERLQRNLQPARPHTRPASRRQLFFGFVAGVAATAAIFLIVLRLTGDSAPSGNQIAFSATEQQTPEVTLTTEDGKNLALAQASGADAPINKQTTKPTDKEIVKMLTLKTPRGRDYQATLGDGTKVWLNTDSRLEIPETFSGPERKVKLHGEAYFEVAKDAAHPFVVETDWFTTRVLGTSFDVRAYSARTASVLLVEGSVRLNAGDAECLMQPGDMASLAGSGSDFDVQQVDPYPYTQWREGFFYYDDTSLYEIMQELGRWYNVNIVFDTPEKMDLRLHFVAERRASVRQAVDNLNELGVAHVEYKNGAITIK
ncbi:MAG: FecR domain-containing protein [Bacteroidales bacterium]|nr:FecR domain-containing protein [Bacteroidales bacterium]